MTDGRGGSVWRTPHRHTVDRLAIALGLEASHAAAQEQALFRRLAVFVGGCSRDYPTQPRPGTAENA